MTTPDPAAVALLAEAQHIMTSDCHETVHWASCERDHGSLARWALYHPRLAAALTRGLALLEAEEALPKGRHYFVLTSPTQNGESGWMASVHGPEGPVTDLHHGDTPDAALRSLTAALREAQP